MTATPARPRRTRPIVRLLRSLALLLALAFALGLYMTQPLVWPLAAAPRGPVQADPARLATHVQRLATTYAPRDAGHPENLDAAAAYLHAELAATGARVVDQPYTAGGWTYRNVVASFGPEAGPRLVVGAHYDACDELPGADDNASGTAGLLELARLLAAESLPVRVDLVAYTLEEPPHYATPSMGSAVHARALKAAKVEVPLMISLEMIGYFADAPDTQSYPLPALRWIYGTRGDFISVSSIFGAGWLVRSVKRDLAEGSGLPVYSINGPRSGLGIELSDQRNYWAEGYAAVMVSDTAMFRNFAYHTAQDTPQRLDYPRMAQVVDGVRRVVLQAAARAADGATESAAR